MRSIGKSVRSVRSVCVKESKISVNKIFVLFVRLLPFGQWAYGESRVQKILVSKTRERPRREQECDPCDPCAYKRQSEIRVQEIFVKLAAKIQK